MSLNEYDVTIALFIRITKRLTPQRCRVEIAIFSCVLQVECVRRTPRIRKNGIFLSKNCFFVIMCPYGVRTSVCPSKEYKIPHLINDSAHIYYDAAVVSK